MCISYANVNAYLFFAYALLNAYLCKFKRRFTVMVDFIDDHKKNYGIEPICRVLPIAPSTYYRAQDLSDNPHKRSLRSQHDDFYISEIRRIWQDSKCRYGARKVWQQMKAEGLKVARCTVERLMKQHGLQGVWRGKGKITTNSRDDQERADDWSIATLTPIVLISCG